MFYIINVCCVYSLESDSPHRGDSNEYTRHTFAREKKKMPLNYPYIVFGGNPCGLKNVFDSIMVNEPSGFEPLKCYCSMSFSVRKRIFCHVLTVKTQISLCVRTVWSEPSLSVWRGFHPWFSKIRPVNSLIRLCECWEYMSTQHFLTL